MLTPCPVSLQAADASLQETLRVNEGPQEAQEVLLRRITTLREHFLSLHRDNFSRGWSEASSPSSYSSHTEADADPAPAHHSTRGYSATRTLRSTESLATSSQTFGAPDSKHNKPLVPVPLHSENSVRCIFFGSRPVIDCPDLRSHI